MAQNEALKIPVDRDAVPHFMNLKQMAEVTLANAKDAPPKFQLCVDAVTKILDGNEVTFAETKGMLDSIGGFFTATHHQVENHPEDVVDGMQDMAYNFMILAQRVLATVQPVWPSIGENVH